MHGHAGFPFIVLNSLCGAYAAYGFSALRYTAAAIILYGVMIALQSLIAIQIMITCVYLTSNQARALAPWPPYPRAKFSVGQGDLEEASASGFARREPFCS